MNGMVSPWHLQSRSGQRVCASAVSKAASQGTIHCKGVVKAWRGSKILFTDMRGPLSGKLVHLSPYQHLSIPLT